MKIKDAKNNVGFVIKSFQLDSENRSLRNELNRIKKRLQEFADSIELKEQKGTGWYVFLKRDKKNNSWQAIGCYNPTSNEFEGTSEELEWDICIPIPEPEGLQEFDGF